MSMLNQSKFNETPIPMDFTYTGIEWAKIAAGLALAVKIMEDMEATKGAMPEVIQTSHDVMLGMAQEISIRMEVREMEMRLDAVTPEDPKP